MQNCAHAGKALGGDTGHHQPMTPVRVALEAEQRDRLLAERLRKLIERQAGAVQKVLTESGVTGLHIA